MEIIDGVLLRIFIGERDKHDGMSLSEWIMRKARDAGLKGATVFRGMAGFGSHSQIHSSRIIDLSDNLPIVLEIADTKENIDKLLEILDGAINEGMATTQPVTMRSYRRK